MGKVLSKLRFTDHYPVQCTNDEAGRYDEADLNRIQFLQEMRGYLHADQQPRQERSFGERHLAGQLSEKGLPVRHPTDEEDRDGEDKEHKT